jgi:hypothetical protein
LLVILFVLLGPHMRYHGAAWALFVATVALIITTILLLLYVMHAVEALYVVPWLLIVRDEEPMRTYVTHLLAGNDLLFHMVCVLLHRLVHPRHGLCHVWRHGHVASSGGSFALLQSITHLLYMQFFGFVATLAYAIDCFIKFNAWRADDPAQGLHPIQRSVPHNGV